jgi:2-polyprenyl-3-methyl-5-hydroxy-6-metoxy-1,4-benzoquinol methylase
MARDWKPREFDLLYDRFICQDEFHFGGKAYYVRYRSRFKECMQRFAALAPPPPIDVLDVGGGQLALMCMKLWGDRAAVADLPGPHMSYMAEHGVKTIFWNLCKTDAPSSIKYDFAFFIEVIEHLPIPGYIVLERLARVLRPGGVVMCTTPNLYRLRNLVFMALGRRIFDYFQYPEGDHALSHVLEYSRDHLDWQFKRAGFTNCCVEYAQFHHWPTNLLYRPLAWLGYPLHLVPHWRDNLIAIGHAPAEIKQDAIVKTCSGAEQAEGGAPEGTGTGNSVASVRC